MKLTEVISRSCFVKGRDGLGLYVIYVRSREKYKKNGRKVKTSLF